jgi:membrane protein DedA with SNARE-associated domain
LHLTPHIKKYAPVLVALVIGIILVTYVLLEIFADSSTQSGGVSITDTVSSWGYPGVFFLMLLEASSLPIPSEVVLPFAGCLVSAGKLDFLLTLLVATVAAVAGSLIDYYIGLKGMEALTKYRLLGRAVFSESQLKVAANYFTKYGAVMVFVGRLIPVIRTLISFPAGAVKMPVTKFLGYTVPGVLIWNCLLIYVGYYLGNKWRDILAFSHYILIGVAVVAAALFAWYMIRRKNKRQKTQAAIKYVT